MAFHPYVNLNIKVRIIFDTAKFFNTFFHKRMRFVYVDIFLYLCIMETKENYMRIGGLLYRITNNEYSYLDINVEEVKSIRELNDMGVNVDFYNRNKIVHPYGK